MGLFNRNPINSYAKSMRFSANRALTIFKEEGERTQRVEEYIQHTRNFAAKILEIDPEHEEATRFKDFPDGIAD